MEQEIEAKFLNVNHDESRTKLKAIGAVCEHPMRLMKRVLFDYPDDRFQKMGQTQRLRIRDEGDKVVINFKSKNDTNYVDEVETAVGSFEKMQKLLEAVGLVAYSYQESKRETWQYKNTEIVLDEWPWLNTYIEIEGPTEDEIKAVARELGFDWSNAKFGSVDTAYKNQYPGMKDEESISDVGTVKFGMDLPEYFKKRMKK